MTYTSQFLSPLTWQSLSYEGAGFQRMECIVCGFPSTRSNTILVFKTLGYYLHYLSKHDPGMQVPLRILIRRSSLML